MSEITAAYPFVPEASNRVRKQTPGPRPCRREVDPLHLRDACAATSSRDEAKEGQDNSLPVPYPEVESDNPLGVARGLALGLPLSVLLWTLILTTWFVAL